MSLEAISLVSRVTQGNGVASYVTTAVTLTSPLTTRAGMSSAVSQAVLLASHIDLEDA